MCIRDRSKALIKRYFCYLDEKGRKTYCNWVIRARYEDGSVSICFPDEVLLMLKEFDKLNPYTCLLYTSDAADDLLCVDLGGRRIIKKKKKKTKQKQQQNIPKTTTKIK